MGKQIGAAIPDWDVSQYPGINGTSTTTPIPLETQVAALINGGSLSSGDLLARISDINERFNSLTYNAPPSIARKLVTEPDLRASVVSNLALLNGYTGNLACKVSLTTVSIIGTISKPSNAPFGTIVCVMPASVHSQIVVPVDAASGESREDRYAVQGTNLIAYSAFSGNIYVSFSAART